MSPLCYATKVLRNDSTSEITECKSVFDWRNVMCMEEEAGGAWQYEKPRTYVTTNHGEFYILGSFEEWAAKMQKWEDFDTQQAGLAFSRN